MQASCRMRQGDRATLAIMQFPYQGHPAISKVPVAPYFDRRIDVDAEINLDLSLA